MRNEEGCGAINPCWSAVACSWSDSRGAAGNENSPDRILRGRSPFRSHVPHGEAFRQGLRELGYEEGKNIVIEWRFGDGKVDRLSALATELVGLKVAVIVTGGTGPTRAAKEATSTIPIADRVIKQHAAMPGLN